MARAGFKHAAATLLACIFPAPRAFPQSGAQNGEWRTLRSHLGNTHYSLLDQINATNFGKLEIAWRFKTGRKRRSANETRFDHERSIIRRKTTSSRAPSNSALR